MAKIIKFRGPIREFTVAVGAYSRGGDLLKICSSRVGAYSREGGGFFERYMLTCFACMTSTMIWESLFCTIAGSSGCVAT